jgi:hypothetical protein
MASIRPGQPADLKSDPNTVETAVCCSNTCSTPYGQPASLNAPGVDLQSLAEGGLVLGVILELRRLQGLPHNDVLLHHLQVTTHPMSVAGVTTKPHIRWQRWGGNWQAVQMDNCSLHAYMPCSGQLTVLQPMSMHTTQSSCC